jgi:hypothetical protein
MLYSKGVYITDLLRRVESYPLRPSCSPYIENMSKPRRIIEDQYLSASSRQKTRTAGTGNDNLAAINVAAAKLARKAQGKRATTYLCGAISPPRRSPSNLNCGPDIDLEAIEHFQEQAHALLEGGPEKGGLLRARNCHDLAEMHSHSS